MARIKACAMRTLAGKHRKSREPCPVGQDWAAVATSAQSATQEAETMTPEAEIIPLLRESRAKHAEP